MYSKSTWKLKYFGNVLEYKYKFSEFLKNVLQYIPSTLQSTDVLKYKVLMPGFDTSGSRWVNWWQGSLPVRVSHVAIGESSK